VPNLLKTSKTPKPIKSKNNNKGRTTYPKPTPPNRGRGKIQEKNKRPDLHLKEKVKNAAAFLKRKLVATARFLYRSRKTVILVVAVVLLTLVFSYLIAPWFSNSAEPPNGPEDRTIPTTGTIRVQGLEIYGGDIKYDPETERIYVDWGELALGASKNATFYVKSTSNVDVTLGLNVTNWEPQGIDNYLTISWDYNGTVLKSGPDQAPVLVTVNLKVASSGDFIDFLVENTVSSFGFDMTIYASGE
jgi:hypothetical protein